ncbi:MAG: hypothetical protein HC906_19835 [Bacteroidales bacterium]|nr:hypothetical protein [Bacteroidales bacterium]
MAGLQNDSTIGVNIKMNDAVIEKFNKFTGIVKENDHNTAINILYPEFRTTYMYYLIFLYPRVIDPDYTFEDEDYL